MEIHIDPIPQAQDIKDKRLMKLMKKYKNIPKHPSRVIITGVSGSGKTSWAYSMLDKPFKGYFDQILVVSGTKDSNSAWEKIKTHDGDKPVIKNEWDADFMEQFLKEIEDEHAIAVADKIHPCRVLIILDDLVADGITQRHRMNIIDKLFVQISRHCSVSVWIMSQFYKALNRNVRAVNMSHMICYPVSKNDLRMICDDHCPAGIDVNSFMNMVDMIHKSKPYQFATFDYTCPPDKRLRNGLGKIIPLQTKNQDKDGIADEE